MQDRQLHDNTLPHSSTQSSAHCNFDNTICSDDATNDTPKSLADSAECRNETKGRSVPHSLCCQATAIASATCCPCALKEQQRPEQQQHGLDENDVQRQLKTQQEKCEEIMRHRYAVRRARHINFVSAFSSLGPLWHQVPPHASTLAASTLNASAKVHRGVSDTAHGVSQESEHSDTLTSSLRQKDRHSVVCSRDSSALMSMTTARSNTIVVPELSTNAAGKGDKCLDSECPIATHSSSHVKNPLSAAHIPTSSDNNCTRHAKMERSMPVMVQSSEIAKPIRHFVDHSMQEQQRHRQRQPEHHLSSIPSTSITAAAAPVCSAPSCLPSRVLPSDNWATHKAFSSSAAANAAPATCLTLVARPSDGNDNMDSHTNQSVMPIGATLDKSSAYNKSSTPARQSDCCHKPDTSRAQNTPSTFRGSSSQVERHDGSNRTNDYNDHDTTNLATVEVVTPLSMASSISTVCNTAPPAMVSSCTAACPAPHLTCTFSSSVSAHPSFGRQQQHRRHRCSSIARMHTLAHDHSRSAREIFPELPELLYLARDRIYVYRSKDKVLGKGAYGVVMLGELYPPGEEAPIARTPRVQSKAAFVPATQRKSTVGNTNNYYTEKPSAHHGSNHYDTHRHAITALPRHVPSSNDSASSIQDSESSATAHISYTHEFTLRSKDNNYNTNNVSSSSLCCALVGDSKGATTMQTGQPCCIKLQLFHEDAMAAESSVAASIGETTMTTTASATTATTMRMNSSSTTRSDMSRDGANSMPKMVKRPAAICTSLITQPTAIEPRPVTVMSVDMLRLSAESGYPCKATGTACAAAAADTKLYGPLYSSVVGSTVSTPLHQMPYNEHTASFYNRCSSRSSTQSLATHDGGTGPSAARCAPRDGCRYRNGARDGKDKIDNYGITVPTTTNATDATATNAAASLMYHATSSSVKPIASHSMDDSSKPRTICNHPIHRKKRSNLIAHMLDEQQQQYPMQLPHTHARTDSFAKQHVSTLSLRECAYAEEWRRGSMHTDASDAAVVHCRYGGTGHRAGHTDKKSDGSSRSPLNRQAVSPRRSSARTYTQPCVAGVCVRSLHMISRETTTATANNTVASEEEDRMPVTPQLLPAQHSHEPQSNCNNDNGNTQAKASAAGKDEKKVSIHASLCGDNVTSCSSSLRLGQANSEQDAPLAESANERRSLATRNAEIASNTAAAQTDTETTLPVAVLPASPSCQACRPQLLNSVDSVHDAQLVCDAGSSEHNCTTAMRALVEEVKPLADTFATHADICHQNTKVTTSVTTAHVHEEHSARLHTSPHTRLSPPAQPSNDAIKKTTQHNIAPGCAMQRGTPCVHTSHSPSLAAALQPRASHNPELLKKKQHDTHGEQQHDDKSKHCGMSTAPCRNINEKNKDEDSPSGVSADWILSAHEPLDLMHTTSSLTELHAPKPHSTTLFPVMPADEDCCTHANNKNGSAALYNAIGHVARTTCNTKDSDESDHDTTDDVRKDAEQQGECDTKVYMQYRHAEACCTKTRLDHTSSATCSVSLDQASPSPCLHASSTQQNAPHAVHGNSRTAEETPCALQQGATPSIQSLTEECTADNTNGCLMNGHAGLDREKGAHNNHGNNSSAACVPHQQSQLSATQTALVAQTLSATRTSSRVVENTHAMTSNLDTSEEKCRPREPCVVREDESNDTHFVLADATRSGTQSTCTPKKDVNVTCGCDEHESKPALMTRADLEETCDAHGMHFAVPFRPVAVKVVNKDTLTRFESKEAAHNEVLMASRLHHPCLINYFGVAEDNEQLFFVMDLSENGNLKQYQERYGVAETREMAARFMADVVLALEYFRDGSQHPYEITPPAAPSLPSASSLLMRSSSVSLHSNNNNNNNNNSSSTVQFPPRHHTQLERNEHVSGTSSVWMGGSSELHEPREEHSGCTGTVLNMDITQPDCTSALSPPLLQQTTAPTYSIHTQSDLSLLNRDVMDNKSKESDTYNSNNADVHTTMNRNGKSNSGNAVDKARSTSCYSAACMANSDRANPRGVVGAMSEVHDRMTDILNADAARAGTVLHRDLKPDNMTLTWDYHVKIGDFGSSCFLGDTARNQFAGSPAYLSPEVIRDAKAGVYSDLWAMGCTLYELLEGKPPFEAETNYLVMQRIKKYKPGTLTFSDGVDKEAQDLVNELIQTQPEKRIGSDERGGFAVLRQHPFFRGIDWDTVLETTNINPTNTDYTAELADYLRPEESVLYCSPVMWRNEDKEVDHGDNDIYMNNTSNSSNTRHTIEHESKNTRSPSTALLTDSLQKHLTHRVPPPTKMDNRHDNDTTHEDTHSNACSDSSLSALSSHQHLSNTVPSLTSQRNLAEENDKTSSETGVGKRIDAVTDVYDLPTWTQPMVLTLTDEHRLLLIDPHTNRVAIAAPCTSLISVAVDRIDRFEITIAVKPSVSTQTEPTDTLIPDATTTAAASEKTMKTRECETPASKTYRFRDKNRRADLWSEKINELLQQHQQQKPIFSATPSVSKITAKSPDTNDMNGNLHRNSSSHSSLSPFCTIHAASSPVRDRGTSSPHIGPRAKISMHALELGMDKSIAENDYHNIHYNLSDETGSSEKNVSKASVA